MSNSVLYIGNKTILIILLILFLIINVLEFILIAAYTRIYVTYLEIVV
jgi:hypothetical protein